MTEMNPTKQIKAVGLEKTYRGRKVVQDVSVDIQKGEVVGLLGPNGAGKSTSFNMIVGMVRADKGSVYINGQDMTKKPMHKRAQQGVAYLPQDASIFRKMTVEDNILSILQSQPLSKQEQKHKLESLMEEFRITKLRKSKAYALSGGERRRLEIARALTTDPDFLLLDEPFAGVDPIAVEEIQQMIAYLKSTGMGILITDHSVRETLAITDRAYIMFEGSVLIQGTAEHLAKDPEARKRYLGSSFSL